MSTRFGKFVLSKHFSILFLILMPLAVLVTAWQTEWAISFLLGRSHIWGIAYIIQILLAVLSVAYDRAVKVKRRRVSLSGLYVPPTAYWLIVVNGLPAVPDLSFSSMRSALGSHDEMQSAARHAPMPYIMFFFIIYRFI